MRADGEFVWYAMTSKKFCPMEDFLPAGLLKGLVLVLFQADSVEVAIIKSDVNSQTTP